MECQIMVVFAQRPKFQPVASLGQYANRLALDARIQETLPSNLEALSTRMNLDHKPTVSSMSARSKRTVLGSL